MRINTYLSCFLLSIVLLFSSLSNAVAQRTYGSSQQTGASGVLCVNCVVNNAANAADGNPQTFSTVRVAVGLAAQTYQDIIFPAAVNSGTPVSLKLGSGDDLLSLQALGAVIIRPYNGATAAGPALTAATLLTAISNSNQVELTITPSQTYDRLRVTLNGGLVGALNSIYLFEAYYKGAGPVPCNTAVDELHGISSALLGLGLGIGGVQNPQQAIDGSLTTFSTLNAGVGLAGAAAQQTILFQNTSVIGDSVRLTLSLPQTLLDLGVLGNIEISTSNGNISNNDTRAFNSNLLSLRLLELTGTQRRVAVTFAPAATFDRVQLRLGGGLANVLSTLNLHEAQRVAPRPVINYNSSPASSIQLCAGATAALSVTPLPNTTYHWYNTETGGTALFSGPNFLTPALNASSIYYVEAVRNGCTDASERSKIMINVTTIPASPAITNNTTTVCPGQPATFTAETVSGVTVNWYTSATGGSPVFTGNSFTTAALSSSTTYFAEAVSGTNCISPSRTQVDAIVSALPPNPVLSAANVDICSGEVAVLSVANPVAGIQYRWYGTATNGNVLYTGNSFTTPALTSNTSYYVEAVNVTGCPSAARTQATVTVQQSPNAAILMANNTSISAGQTATMGITNAQTGVTYQWYLSANGSTPVFTGTTYTTPPLYANTTYYVSATNATGCTSSSRGSLTINVNIDNNAPCSFANLQSSNVNGLCVGCSVTNNLLATDADTTTASTINVVAGILGAFAEQELRFAQPGFVGDTIKLKLQTPVGLADATLLGRIEVALYNGATEVARYALNNPVLGLSLLGGNMAQVYVPAAGNYDRITVRLNSGALSALTAVQVYYAMQHFATPTYTPLNAEICRGATAQLNITSPANGGTFSFYDVPAGGVALQTGLSFTTPTLTANTTYYIEYSRNCITQARTPVTIMVNDVPAKPVIAQTNVTINSGQTATFSATAPANATINWYTTPTNGSPIFTGDTFTTPPLTTNTMYYAESALGSCISLDRTAVTVNVNQVIPDITVTPPTRTINPGQTTSFTASSTTPNVTFNWYTAPTGGVPVFSGPNFTTPPTFGNTIYYVEAVDNITGIASATRATATINVNPVVSNNVPCDAAIDQTTDINGLVCLGCSISNAAAAVDNDRNTFSRLSVPLGLVNAYAGQTLRFGNVGHAGDSIIVELGVTGSLADVSVLAGISLATYNGNNFNNDRFTVNGSTLSISLLNGDSRFRIAFTPAQDFDRVEIRLNAAIANLLTSLNIYDASQAVAAPVLATPTVATCAGSQATLAANVPAHVTVKWYTSASGGTPVFTGSTFTTPVLSSNAMFYAEASRTTTGCTQNLRTPVTVNVFPIPAPPTVAIPNVTVCTGQPATFSAQHTPGLTVNWYANPTGGTLLFTGDTFTTGALNSTTSYYAEAVGPGSCASLTRSMVTATVASTVDDPQLAQNPTQTCAGTSAVLTASSLQAGVTFNWYTTQTGGTPIFTGAQFTTPPLNANATYYVEAVSGTCVSQNRIAANVTVNPLPANPTLSVTPSSAQISSGQTATITAASTTPGSNFNWYATANGGTAIFTGASFTTPPLTTNTTYFVESITAATGCVSSTRTPITIIVNPVFSTTCDFASAQVNAANGLCVGCSVITPNNAIDADTTNFSRLNLTVALLGAHVQQELIFNDPGALGDSVTLRLRFPVNITSLGVLDRIRIASYNGATFNNDAVYLNNSLVRVQVLPGGQSALVKFAPQASFDRVGIRLESVVAGLFSELDIFYATKQVEIPQLAQKVQNICAGGAATFIVANARPGITYEWFTTATGGTSFHTGTSYTATGVNNSTTFYVQSTRTANSCVNPNRVAAIINVTPLPTTPTLVQTSFTICAGEQVTLSVNNAGSATIRWYDQPTGGNLLFTGANFNVSPIASSSYYAESLNGSCSSSARSAATVTVNTRPLSPTVAASQVEVCQGSSASLLIQNPEPGVTYEWFTAATGGTSVGTGASLASPPITTTTTFYVQATNANSCVNNGGRVAVTVSPGGQISAPTLSSTQTQVCSGGNASITVVNPMPGILYNWYTQATLGTPVFTGTTFTLNNLTGNATYYVEASNGAGCTSATRTQTSIVVQPVPQQPLVQAPAGGLNVCEGSSATLSIANPQPDLVYRWFDSPSNGTLLFTGTVYTTPVLTTNTTYHVEAVSAGNCNPSARTAVSLTVSTRPADAVLVSNTVNACPGATATFVIAMPQAGITYQWFDSPAQTNKLFEGTTFVTGPVMVNTTYYVAAVNTSSCRSSNLSTAMAIVQGAPSAPVIAEGSAIQACSGTRPVLSIASPEPAYTYHWYSAATGGTLLNTGTTFSVPPLTNNVSYYVEARTTGGCASGRTAISITVNTSPTAPAPVNASVSVCSGTAATLSVTPTAGITINWYTTATGGTPIFTGNTFTTPVLNLNATYYAEAVNASTCTSQTRSPIVVTVLQQLPAPTITVGAVTANSITFNLSFVSGATGYEVSTDNGANFTQPSSGANGLSHTVSNLQPNQSVTLVARAVGALNCQLSAVSNAVTALAANPLGDGIFVPNAFSPNGDGQNDRLHVYGNAIKSMKFWVYDQWGELQYNTTNRSDGWNGTYRGRQQPVGVYVYYLEVITNDGNLIKKKGTITLLR